MPGFVSLTAPLRNMVNDVCMKDLAGLLHWTKIAERSFVNLEAVLARGVDLTCLTAAIVFGCF